MYAYIHTHITQASSEITHLETFVFEQSAFILFNSLHYFVSSQPASFTTVFIIMYSFYSQCSLCCNSSLSFILKKEH